MSANTDLNVRALLVYLQPECVLVLFCWLCPGPFEACNPEVKGLYVSTSRRTATHCTDLLRKLRLVEHATVTWRPCTLTTVPACYRGPFTRSPCLCFFFMAVWATAPSRQRQVHCRG